MTYTNNKIKNDVSKNNDNKDNPFEQKKGDKDENDNDNENGIIHCSDNKFDTIISNKSRMLTEFYLTRIVYSSFEEYSADKALMSYLKREVVYDQALSTLFFLEEDAIAKYLNNFIKL